MQHRKDLFVQKLGLTPLSKEGGYFKETFRSPETIQVPGREGNERNVFTTIYYMISPELGGKNYLHSNKSDNTHYFHEGWPAHYILVSPEGKIEEHILGRDFMKGHVPQLRVPGGYLKGGKILVDEKECASFPGEIPFTLISEEVAPGFDYRDRHVPTGIEVKSMYPKLWNTLEEFIAPAESDNEVNEGNLVKKWFLPHMQMICIYFQPYKTAKVTADLHLTE